MESAGLSELRGKPPFGGAILSHDFVEAALLRRAGWKVRTAMDLNGSYEECPPSLLDLAIRDRRWCQGNLQHSRLITQRGLHWVSRMHFISGIMSYLASPLWLLLILCGFALALQAQFVRPEYFPDYFTFFPQWPIIDPARALALFFATMGILLMPKLYGYILLIFDSKWRNEAGGVVHGLISVVMEIVLSALIAPIMMLIQTGAVLGVLRGRDTGWTPQRRDGGQIAFSAIAKRHARHMIFGLILTFGAFAVSPALAAWMSPTLIGLLLAILLSAWTASRAAGLFAKRLGLFLTPEEVEPPRVAEIAERVRPVYADVTAHAADITRLASNPDARASHIWLIDPEQRPAKGRFDAAEIIAAAKIAESSSVAEALELMTPPERQALVNSRRLIVALAAKAG
jgi:membrane glycosyltransferase